MKPLDKDQSNFIKVLLEDELHNLNIKRSKSKKVREFDQVCGERMKYIEELIIYLK